MNNFYRNWMPVIAWCSLIFYLSSLQNLGTHIGWIIDLVLRKGAHVTEYCVLFLLSRRAITGSIGAWSGKKASLASIAFSVLYAASDEYHQSFVPTRGPSVIDVGIDSVGAVAGYFIYSFWKGHIERKNEA